MDNLAFRSGPNDNGSYQTKSPVNGNGSPVKGENPNKTVTVLGSGDYGRAISGRLVKSGYKVYIGSRDPNRSTIKQLVRVTGATLLSQEVAVSASKIIIIAVGRDHYDHLPINQLKGKILIDVSNNTTQRRGPHYRSNAEYLQGLIPQAEVVKSFNVLSAYSLENGGLQGSKEVFYAGDDDAAKAVVATMIRNMGFTPTDWGTIKAARDIEGIPMQLMPSWKRPVAVVFGIFLFMWVYALISFQICPNAVSGKWEENWKYLPQTNFNRVIGICALWTLAFCYLPGLLAAYIQLYRGTKYSRFPKWLDDWLKMRKQLGLLMLALAGMHACISVAFVTPQTTSWVYENAQKYLTIIKTDNGTAEKEFTIYSDHFNWRGELFLTCGAVATCLLVILGISSLPSVTATLSWREFTFIQSKLGWVALITASLHDIFLAWHYMFIYWGCEGTIPIGPQYALYPSFICVVLKIPLLLPPVNNYLEKIRRGYDRSRTSSSRPEIA